MFKYRFVQILTICFQLCLIAALFIPVTKDYNVYVTLYSQILKAFTSGNAQSILTLSMYYVPAILTIVLLLIFNGSFKYVLSAIFSAMGLTLTLIQFVYPAVATPYLFATYQIGLYILISIQVLSVILCIIGSQIQISYNLDRECMVDTNSDTEEIIIEDIKKRMNKK